MMHGDAAVGAACSDLPCRTQQTGTAGPTAGTYMSTARQKADRFFIGKILSFMLMSIVRGQKHYSNCSTQKMMKKVLRGDANTAHWLQ